MRKTSRWWWLPLALVLASACTRDAPEARLRATVAALQQAIGERDAGSVRRTLAGDFIGPEGLDREGAVRLAQAMFLRHRAVGIHAGPLTLEMGSAHATVRFQAALTGGDGGVLPETARLYRVETGWRLEEGDWRLVSIAWQPRP